MIAYWKRGLLAAGLCLLPLVSVSARAQGYVTARVSDEKGHLAVHGISESAASYVDLNAVVRGGDTLWTDEKGRAELELDHGAWVRLADSTKVEVRAVTAAPEFRIWNGAVYYQSSPALKAAWFRTPEGDVQCAPGSTVRVDLSDGKGARVSVLSGEARVVCSGAPPVVVPAGRRAYFQAEKVSGAPEAFNRADLDEFDQYEVARAKYVAVAPAPEHLHGYLLGARELEGNGGWVRYHDHDYWHPRVDAAWRPYSTGYWSYVAGVGYTWVDNRPWGYCTSHYGRWTYLPGYGWSWSPLSVWGPSYVAWSHYGDYYGWAPLDPFGRPCYYHPAGVAVGLSFRFGGVSVGLDLLSWSFCPMAQFFYCRPAYASGPFYRTVNQININRTTVRNFSVVNNVYSGIGVPASAVRGLTVGRDGAVARDTVLHTDSRIPAQRLQRAASRFHTAANADQALTRNPSVAESFQRNRNAPLAQTQVLRGAAGAQRFHAGMAGAAVGAAAASAAAHAKPAANGGLAAHPAATANRDDAFRHGGAKPAVTSGAAGKPAAASHAGSFGKPGAHASGHPAANPKANNAAGHGKTAASHTGTHAAGAHAASAHAHAAAAAHHGSGSGGAHSHKGSSGAQGHANHGGNGGGHGHGGGGGHASQGGNHDHGGGGGGGGGHGGKDHHR